MKIDSETRRISLEPVPGLEPWTLEHKAVTPSHEEVHDCIIFLFNIVFFFLNSNVTFAFNCYFILKSRVNMGLPILK